MQRWQCFCRTQPTAGVNEGRSNGRAATSGETGRWGRADPQRLWSAHIVRWRAVTLPRHKGRLVPHIRLPLLLLHWKTTLFTGHLLSSTLCMKGGWMRVSLPGGWPSMLRFRVVIPRYQKNSNPHTAVCSLPCPSYLTGGSSRRKTITEIWSSPGPPLRALTDRARCSCTWATLELARTRPKTNERMQ